MDLSFLCCIGYWHMLDGLCMKLPQTSGDLIVFHLFPCCTFLLPVIYFSGRQPFGPYGPPVGDG